jgi:single-stranded DNA-binding protein
MSNGEKKLSFGLSSNKPNKHGIWNKIYCTAFGETAVQLEKLLVKGVKLNLCAEQQVYTDKNGAMRHNYLVQGFQILDRPVSSNPKQNTENDGKDLPDDEKSSEPSNGSGTTTKGNKDAKETKEKPVNKNVVDGYDAMMQFMSS